MAVSDIVSNLTPRAMEALASLRDAIVENVAIMKARALGALAGLAGVTFGGSHAAGEQVAVQNVGAPIRGGPETGRA